MDMTFFSSSSESRAGSRLNADIATDSTELQAKTTMVFVYFRRFLIIPSSRAILYINIKRQNMHIINPE